MIPKFRFWYEREDFYPDENYMRDVWGIEYITDSKIKLNDDYIFNPYTNVAENIYAKTKIYLMQSTGLKDKNGVEIFEGDILYLEPFKTHSNDRVVEHIAGAYHGKLIRNGYSKLLAECVYETKVIGNIWEDPELLEVAE